MIQTRELLRLARVGIVERRYGLARPCRRRRWTFGIVRFGRCGMQQPCGTRSLPRTRPRCAAFSHSTRRLKEKSYSACARASGHEVTEKLAGRFELIAEPDFLFRYRPVRLIDAIWQRFAEEIAGMIACAKCPAPKCGPWFPQRRPQRPSLLFPRLPDAAAARRSKRGAQHRHLSARRHYQMSRTAL